MIVQQVNNVIGLSPESESGFIRQCIFNIGNSALPRYGRKFNYIACENGDPLPIKTIGISGGKLFYIRHDEYNNKTPIPIEEFSPVTGQIILGHSQTILLTKEPDGTNGYVKFNDSLVNRINKLPTTHDEEMINLVRSATNGVQGVLDYVELLTL